MTQFNDYWSGVEAELADVSPALELERVPRMSSDVATIYRAAFTSIGPYRLGGFLSVPTGGGPFPGLLATPRYGSVNQPPHPFDQDRYVVLVVMHRGQRLADMPFKARYPGLLTQGIADPAGFVFRGIAADTLRAFEVLAGHEVVDRGRIAATGGDLAVIAAARRPISAVAVTEPLLFYRVADAMGRTTVYPTAEYLDHIRARPGERDAVLATTSLFDPERHAQSVRAKVLLPVGDAGSMGGPEWIASLLEEFGGRAETLALSHRGGRDNDAIDAWLSAALGVPARPRSWTVAK